MIVALAVSFWILPWMARRYPIDGNRGNWWGGLLSAVAIWAAGSVAIVYGLGMAGK